MLINLNLNLNNNIKPCLVASYDIRSPSGNGLTGLFLQPRSLCRRSLEYRGNTLNSDRVSEEGNAMGSVCLFLRPSVSTSFVWTKWPSDLIFCKCVGHDHGSQVEVTGQGLDVKVEEPTWPAGRGLVVPSCPVSTLYSLYGCRLVVVADIDVKVKYLITSIRVLVRNVYVYWLDISYLEQRSARPTLSRARRL